MGISERVGTYASRLSNYNSLRDYTRLLPEYPASEIIRGTVIMLGGVLGAGGLGYREIGVAVTLVGTADIIIGSIRYFR
jgi:hypothetical protein